jgi:hypothetical protein
LLLPYKDLPQATKRLRVQALPWGHEALSPEHDPGPERPSLSDEERTERLRRLTERMFSPDGLDHETLKHIEQLTDEDS